MSEVLSPRIYIGAGGSGRRMVSRLKQEMMDDRHLTEEQKAAFQFIAIDAEEYSEGECAPLDRDREYIHVGGFKPALAQQAENIGPAVADWWYDTYKPSYIQQGAGAVRLIGRLCLFYHYHLVRTAIERAAKRASAMAAGRRLAAETTIYVIGSLAGGTGSSMLLDLGYLARQVCHDRQVYVNAVILLPDVFTVSEVNTNQRFKDRWKANGYAALKELVYFNDNPTKFRPWYRANSQREPALNHPRMYDQCFFIEPVANGGGTVISSDQVLNMAAKSLYLFSASEHGSVSAAVMVNTEGMNYASLGMQALVFPRYEVTSYMKRVLTARYIYDVQKCMLGAVDDEALPTHLDRFLMEQPWGNLLKYMQSAVGEFKIAKPEISATPDMRRDINNTMSAAGRLLQKQKERLDQVLENAKETLVGQLDAELSGQIRSEKNLAWCRAFVSALSDRMSEQKRALDTQAREARTRRSDLQRRLSTLDYPWAVFRLFGVHTRRANAAQEALEELHSRLAPSLQVKEAALDLCSYLQFVLTTWSERLDRLHEQAVKDTAGQEEREAETVVEELRKLEGSMGHIAYSVSSQSIATLTERVELPALWRVNSNLQVWNWVREDGSADGLKALSAALEEKVEVSLEESVQLDLLSAWELVAGEDAVRQAFRSTAMNCQPLWNYVVEKGREQMTKVIVLERPPHSKWRQWLSDLPLDIRPIESENRDRVLFLTVEGCQRFPDVHLKEIDEWFRTYQRVHRDYDLGKDPRPLHANKYWRSLSDVTDSTLLPDPMQLFGPAVVRGFITYDEDEPAYYLNNPDAKGKTRNLGKNLDEAMEALSRLPDEEAAALFAAMAQYDKDEIGNFDDAKATWGIAFEEWKAGKKYGGHEGSEGYRRALRNSMEERWCHLLWQYSDGAPEKESDLKWGWH